MKGPSTPYWDRLVAKGRDTMRTLKALVAKLVAKIKTEPAVTTGGVVGVAAVVQQWIATNHITTVKQGLTLAVPIAVTFVIRAFVTPTAKADAVQRQLDLLTEAVKVTASPAFSSVSTLNLSKVLADTEAKVFPGGPVTP